MRILFLGEYNSSEIVPAPIKVGKELFREFKKASHQIYYLPYFQDGKIYSKYQKLFGYERINENVHRTGIFPLIFFAIKFRPQIVQLITPAVYYFFLLPLRFFFKFKIIYSNHSVISIMNKKYSKLRHYDKARFKLIEKLALKYSDKIFVLSELEARFLRVYLKVPEERIEIVRNGITLYNINKEYTDYTTIIKLITVGSIERKEKGLDFLINTLRLLGRPIELTICNYEDQENLKLKNPENVKIFIKSPMNENDLREEIRKHDLFIVASEYEPFNISLLEAMNTGIIILASSRVGLTERFSEDLKCLIFKYNNENSLLGRINYFLQMNDETKIHFSSKIREFSNDYSWVTVANDYLEIYNQVLIQ